MNTDISQKRIVVTGASSGLGQAVARAFVGEGATVAMLARRADVLEGQTAQWGQRAIPIAADVSDPTSCYAAMREAEVRLGGFDAVVNAAGIGFPTPLEEVEPSVWHDMIATNLSGSFYVARYAGLRMRQDGGGAIVNVSSELGTVGMKNFVPYCASKFGVIGLTKALAAELAPSVNVNVVCPGPIDTPQLDAELDWFPDPAQARVDAMERVPLKRFASPDEVAAAIRFLAFDAPFATGTVMALDGGLTTL